MARPAGGDALIMARLDSVPPVSSADGHALAGFLEAESSLNIVPSSDRRSWKCACSAVLREDDAGVLLEFQRITGLGSLSRRRAPGNAAPQVVWYISSRLECARLVELLDTYPMRGRKAFEFQAWAHAAMTWSRCPVGRAVPPRARLALSRAADHLAQARRYVDPPRRLLAASALEPGLQEFLGGFFTGEGCLVLWKGRPRVAINLRRDDRPLLELLVAHTGLGRLYDSAACGTSKPATRWQIYRHDQLLPAITVLENAGLRGRKAMQFSAWRRGATEIAIARHEGRARDLSVIESATHALKAARTYQPPPPGAIETGRVGPTAQEVLVSILQAWAQEHRGPLSGTAYTEAARNRVYWPSRNTIASAFGSWSAALAAADLSDRTAVSDDLRRLRATRSRQARQAKDSERTRRQRTSIIEAVGTLRSQLGRDPTFQEFAQWRAEGHRHLPAPATVYRRFPRGWPAVLEAAGS